MPPATEVTSPRRPRPGPASRPRHHRGGARHPRRATTPPDRHPAVTPEQPPVAPVLTTRPSWQGRAEDAVRRTLDVVLAVSALVLLAPVLIGAAVVVAVAEGRPILFRQVRIGRDGRTFTMLKLRTMVRDAEQVKATLQAANECDGPLFKLADDPRITRTGRVLRETSIDELPQLLNVLAGHMSLVGPRPALPDEVAAFDVEHRNRRQGVRPGITGAWQAFARADRAFHRYRELDLWYLEHRSLALDARILARTTRQALSGISRAIGPARGVDASPARGPLPEREAA